MAQFTTLVQTEISKWLWDCCPYWLPLASSATSRSMLLVTYLLKYLLNSPPLTLALTLFRPGIHWSNLKWTVLSSAVKHTKDTLKTHFEIQSCGHILLTQMCSGLHVKNRLLSWLPPDLYVSKWSKVFLHLSVFHIHWIICCHHHNLYGIESRGVTSDHRRHILIPGVSWWTQSCSLVMGSSETDSIRGLTRASTETDTKNVDKELSR